MEVFSIMLKYERSNMDTQKEYIPVTADKSPIITIGEGLYTENIEFGRKIVNSAYAAYASLVEITD